MTKEKSRELIAAIIFLILFLLVAFLVKAGTVFKGIDEEVSEFFAERQSIYGLQVMEAVSFAGSIYILPLFVIIVSLFFYLKENSGNYVTIRPEFSNGQFGKSNDAINRIVHKDRKRKAVAYFFTFVFGAIIGELFKAGFGRERPLNPFEIGFSFPSIHALTAILGFGALAYLYWGKNRRVCYILIALCFLEGLSRLYLNVHWFSDVLAGYLLGIGILLLGIWRFFERKRVYGAE